ncbi:hypothetical protein [Actimicrobium antarcticum]|uniref:Leucine Rich repeats (2 copies) n=1 Tax=Actimicrobium antarcticum TaxID=1051899 RepID=A0ABP7TFM6_9BURK
MGNAIRKMPCMSASRTARSDTRVPDVAILVAVLTTLEAGSGRFALSPNVPASSAALQAAAAQPPEVPIPAIFCALQDMPDELLVRIASRPDTADRKNFRRIARKFRSAGAEPSQAVALRRRRALPDALSAFGVGGIRKLDLANGDIADDDLRIIAPALGAQAQRLRHLDISNNPALTVAGLEQLPQLQQFDLGRCTGITNVHLQSLANQSQLQHLSLQRCVPLA